MLHLPRHFNSLSNLWAQMEGTPQFLFRIKELSAMWLWWCRKGSDIWWCRKGSITHHPCQLYHATQQKCKRRVEQNLHNVGRTMNSISKFICYSIGIFWQPYIYIHQFNPTLIILWQTCPSHFLFFLQNVAWEVGVFVETDDGQMLVKNTKQISPVQVILPWLENILRLRLLWRCKIILQKIFFLVLFSCVWLAIGKYFPWLEKVPWNAIWGNLATAILNIYTYNRHSQVTTIYS